MIPCVMYIARPHRKNPDVRMHHESARTKEEAQALMRSKVMQHFRDHLDSECVGNPDKTKLEVLSDMNPDLVAESILNHIYAKVYMGMDPFYGVMFVDGEWKVYSYYTICIDALNDLHNELSQATKRE